ncbi:MAG: polysaccharide deacetylase family protein [Erythrobacter sp.]
MSRSPLPTAVPATASPLEPPDADSFASFAPGFGQRVLLTVDTEEEFVWNGTFSRDGFGLSHVSQIARFQEFCEGLGANPLYLVDWPIVNDGLAVEIIGDAVRRGVAEVGVQLHPWVNPPFEEVLSVHNSFAGNLAPALEAAKLMALRDRIEQAFGTAPLSYRAGRYGLGPHTTALLRHAGIMVDTSVRALYDYSHSGGPDYSHFPLIPYWADRERAVLEVPVTSVYRGALSRAGSRLRKMERHVPSLLAGFSRLGLIERIGLTPEGTTIAEGLRGIGKAVDMGLPVLVLTFHSPSLSPGHTPWVETVAEVEGLYCWFAAVYGELARRGVASTTIAEIIAAAR